MMHRLIVQQTSHNLARTAARARSTLAIARHIPNSFIDAVSQHADDATKVCLTTARHQHDIYLHEMRKRTPTMCLPSIEHHPDCVFVEDTVVAIDNTAVICRLGHTSRMGEVDSVKEVLEQLGMEVIDMRNESSNNSDSSTNNNEEVACCDGGDVLYTGRHLFVGLSDRTNKRGFELLRRVFGNKVDVVVVPPIIQGKDVLHLKSAVTHIDENTIIAPAGNLGDSLLDTMSSKDRGYTAIRVPDILSCNAVTINDHVLAQDSCDKSKEAIENACVERGFGLTFVDTTELAKKDAALTCCSVLLSL